MPDCWRVMGRCGQKEGPPIRKHGDLELCPLPSPGASGLRNMDNVKKYNHQRQIYVTIRGNLISEDGGEIGGSRVHFPSAPVKRLSDLRNRMNSQWYSSIYEDRRPKIEDIERSDGKKSA